jgi:DNA-binding transcriptional regulator YiaG
MNCPNGHGPMKEQTLKEYEAAPLLGLRSVVVKSLRAFVCPSCDATLIPGELLDRLHEALLLDVLIDEHILGPEEVRFLRKALRLSQAELSGRLGVHRTTVTRWETGEVPIEPPVSIAIRAIAAVSKFESLPAAQRKALTMAFQKTPLAKRKKAYELRVA